MEERKMTTKKEISMVGFTIVAHAGDAKVDLLNAIDCARKGNFIEADQLIESANQSIVAAHKEQTAMLSREAGGEEMETTFIMMHGQDTLMTTMLFYDQSKFFIDEYKRIHQLEKDVLLLKEEKDVK